jgi:hypothetical protein
MALVRGAADAVPALRDAELAPSVVVGVPSSGRLFDSRFVEGALDPCVAKDDAATDDDEATCGRARSLALGTVGASMVRPLLAEWPESERDVDSLAGEARIDHGFALQLLASANAGTLFPPRAPVDFFAPAVGVAAGLSYRWGTYLPGRRDRALAELNVGVTESLHYDSAGRAGGYPHVTMLDQELRWPIAYEVLTSYLLPLDLRKNHDEGTFVFFSGLRVHEVLTNPLPVFWGLELEVIAIALSHGRGAYPLYASSPELRFHLGAADPGATHGGLPHRWGPTIAITFTGGYATFL